MTLKAVHKAGKNPEQIFVFLHGITGTSETTWAAPGKVRRLLPGKPVTWLANLLPKDFNANIYTCGWDWTEANTMHDLGGSFIKTLSSLADNVLREKFKNIPIVLIGHDLGCIIIQKAMYMLQNFNADSLYVRIAANIAGIIFIDPPFHEASNRFFTRFYNKGAGCIEPLVNPQENASLDSYLELLKFQSPICREIVDNFHELVAFLQGRKMVGPLTCFCSGSPHAQYEKALSWPSQSLDVKWKIIEVSASHSGMTKFMDGNEPEYKEFVKQIREQIDFINVPYRWVDLSDAPAWSS